MKKTGMIIWLMVLCVTGFGQTSADAILGTWLTGSGKAKVKIYKDGDHFNGRIVWLGKPTYEDGTPKMDKKNPDANRQNTPLMGLNLLKGFVFDKTDTWEDGTIYDPENGKLYNCKIRIRDGNKLDVRGYIGISLLGRTETWFKVGDIRE